ncbi:hypothetical protein JRQ81_014747 [Phrynocephalus forsythii]|uniref:Retrotransposon gag domain-containing protein n=1 Tax=Phrynocephalus forsythii TaxID=171643 RepID=A0A9Q1B344_9SAUR|nr:hypothetical protein JRQ81_014747 [Phrynocephalus forsythii]
MYEERKKCRGSKGKLDKKTEGPVTGNEAPWDVLQEKLKVHYEPKPSNIASCHAFHHQNQAEGEAINTYVAVLQKTTLYCEFRDLDDAQLDRIVCGVRDEKLQCKLLAKTDLTLKQATMDAQAAEEAKLSTQEISRPNSPPMPRNPTSVHHSNISDSEPSTSEEDKVCQVKTAQGRATGHARSAHHKKGSPRSANKDCYAISKCRHFREAATTIGQAYVPSARKLHVTVQITGAHCDMEIDMGLLGLEWFAPLGLEVTRVPSISDPNVDVFDGTLGQYTGTPISFSLDPLIFPICLKLHQIPFTLKSMVDKQTSKLIMQGALEPVDHAKWETLSYPSSLMYWCTFAGYKCTINKAL